MSGWGGGRLQLPHVFSMFNQKQLYEQNQEHTLFFTRTIPQLRAIRASELMAQDKILKEHRAPPCIL